jgi:hypothetical protein
MKNKLFFLAISIVICSCTSHKTKKDYADGEKITLQKSLLVDKIKGGWAGQVIGCTYGGPTEFRYKGTMIQDYQPIPWRPGYIKWWYENAPGLYDDVYMDLTFVDVFERCGINAPVDSFALAYAHAGYSLWHANQSGRYNILRGIMPPQSGYWLNNPHADCIDYQIESDFSGLMSPGMPNTASEISDKIGHIMNYGDGWYGGVYVGAMYSLAFVSNDIEFIVKEALKTIPVQSQFYQCINEVIQNHEKYPADWKQTWAEVEKHWTEDVGCPDGVFDPFDIDATVNAAYIVIGLLYGEGDFAKTINIATRCGQDSDCNPASAGGILGAILGYSKIPAPWKENILEVEGMDFKYTSISLNDLYILGPRQAFQNITAHGGTQNDSLVTLIYQVPRPVRFEKSFEGIYPIEKRVLNHSLAEPLHFEFEGTGFVIRGEVTVKDEQLKKYVAEVDLYVDGTFIEKAMMPVDFASRRNELFWNYKLSKGKHRIDIKWINPLKDNKAETKAWDVILYSDQKVKS